MEAFYKAGQEMFTLGVSNGLVYYQNKGISYWSWPDDHSYYIRFNATSWKNFAKWFIIPDAPKYSQYMKSVNNIRAKLADTILIQGNNHTEWYLYDFVRTFNFAMIDIFMSNGIEIISMADFDHIAGMEPYYLQLLLEVTNTITGGVSLDCAVNRTSFDDIYSFLKRYPHLLQLQINSMFSAIDIKLMKPYWNAFMKGMYEHAFSYGNTHYIP